MIITIKWLDDLSQERKALELEAIANKAVRLYRTSDVPTVRAAILAVMEDIRVSGSESDIAEIENRASRKVR